MTTTVNLMSKDNIISLADRLERWKKVYTSPQSEFDIVVSSRGNLKIVFKNREAVPSVNLDFIESVKFMSDVSKAFEEVMIDSTN